MQRALLQWYRPEKRALVLEALHKAHRTDLIGYGKHCLVRPDKTPPAKPVRATAKPAQNGRRPKKGK